MTDRRRWESALFLKVRDEIQTGNLAIDGAKNFGRFEAFFLPAGQCGRVRDAFWARTGFPGDPDARRVEQLKARLSDAFDRFLEGVAEGQASGWKLGRPKGSLGVSVPHRANRVSRPGAQDGDSTASPRAGVPSTGSVHRYRQLGSVLLDPDLSPPRTRSYDIVMPRSEKVLGAKPSPRGARHAWGWDTGTRLLNWVLPKLWRWPQCGMYSRPRRLP